MRILYPISKFNINRINRECSEKDDESITMWKKNSRQIKDLIRIKLN